MIEALFSNVPSFELVSFTFLFSLENKSFSILNPLFLLRIEGLSIFFMQNLNFFYLLIIIVIYRHVFIVMLRPDMIFNHFFDLYDFILLSFCSDEILSDQLE